MVVKFFKAAAANAVGKSGQKDDSNEAVNWIKPKHIVN